MLPPSPCSTSMLAKNLASLDDTFQIYLHNRIPFFHRQFKKGVALFLPGHSSKYPLALTIAAPHSAPLNRLRSWHPLGTFGLASNFLNIFTDLFGFSLLRPTTATLAPCPARASHRAAQRAVSSDNHSCFSRKSNKFIFHASLSCIFPFILVHAERPQSF